MSGGNAGAAGGGAVYGLTQQELAKRVGTSRSAISRIESGRHKTSVDTLQRIAEALGLADCRTPPVGSPRGRDGSCREI